MEYERLQAEAAQLGSQLSQALSERDSQASLAQETIQKLSKSTNENSLFQKQLDDLGRQIQHLLREIARRDDPTIPSNEELEAIPIEAVSDTADLISNHLVLFRNIDGLQQQNQRLLKIVRDLGEKMESEEREYRETMEREQAEAVREAHEAMQELAIQLERQKQSSDSVVKAYVRDRDALKAMLARTETGARSDTSGVANGAIAAASGDLEKELAEVQSRFDTYKLEMDIDSGRLRDDFLAAQREVNATSASLAKANAKVEFLTGKEHFLAKYLLNLSSTDRPTTDT
jgi:nucleoprotein TPR